MYKIDLVNVFHDIIFIHYIILLSNNNDKKITIINNNNLEFFQINYYY